MVKPDSTKFMKTPQVHGALSMGLFFAWILYIPFYGPGMQNVASWRESLSHVFMLTHIAGFLHCGWTYSRVIRNDTTLGWIERICLAAVAVLTVIFSYAMKSGNAYVLFSIFALLGYASGRLVIRWTAWFSSPLAAPFRGAVWGIALAVMNIVLFLLTMLSHAGNTELGLVISAALALLGGYGIIRLPVQKSEKRPLKLLSAVPPRLVLIFGVLMFLLSGYPYRQIFPVHVQFPIYLSWLILVPYLLVGFFLGRWSDKNRHQYLAVISLLLLGMAFTLGTLIPTMPNIILAVEIFVLSGNVCGNLYYWTALADHGSVTMSPLTMSIGLSLEILIFALTFMSVPYIPETIAGSQAFIGVVGVLLVLVGIAALTYSKFLPLNKGNIAMSANEGPPASPGVMLPHAVTKERMEEVLIRQYNLTGREFEVVYLLIMGYSNEKIGQMLFISQSTVKFHIRNVLRKMDGMNRHDIRDKVYKCCIE